MTRESNYSKLSSSCPDETEATEASSVSVDEFFDYLLAIWPHHRMKIRSTPMTDAELRAHKWLHGRSGKRAAPPRPDNRHRCNYIKSARWHVQMAMLDDLLTPGKRAKLEAIDRELKLILRSIRRRRR